MDLIPSLRAPSQTVLAPENATRPHQRHSLSGPVEVDWPVADGGRDQRGRQPVEEGVGDVDGARVLRVERRDELDVFAALFTMSASPFLVAGIFVRGDAEASR